MTSIPPHVRERLDELSEFEAAGVSVRAFVVFHLASIETAFTSRWTLWMVRAFGKRSRIRLVNGEAVIASWRGRVYMLDSHRDAGKDG